MGSESGQDTTGEFKELYDELGWPDGERAIELGVDPITLVQVTRGEDVYAGTIIAEMPLGNPIIDDPEDREKYQLFSLDRRIFRVWGGALAPDEATLGNALIGETNIQKAMLPGGGVKHGGKILPVLEYHQGFSLEASVTSWYLVTQSIRLVE